METSLTALDARLQRVRGYKALVQTDGMVSGADPTALIDRMLNDLNARAEADQEVAALIEEAGGV